MIKGQDMIFKLISTHYIIVLLSILGHDTTGIDEKAIEFLTYEQVKIKPSLRRPDFIVIERVILMIEFQSTLANLKDAMRFDGYMTTFTETFCDKLIGNIDKIRFIILSTAEKTKIKQYHRFDGSNVYFSIISLADSNKNEIISIIKEKINKHVNFSDEDAVKLALTPLIDIKKENIESQFYQTRDLMKQGIWKNEKQKNASYAIILILMEMYSRMMIL